jgi:hypothetical protein
VASTYFFLVEVVLYIQLEYETIHVQQELSSRYISLGIAIQSDCIRTKRSSIDLFVFL